MIKPSGLTFNKRDNISCNLRDRPQIYFLNRLGGSGPMSMTLTFFLVPCGSLWINVVIVTWCWLFFYLFIYNTDLSRHFLILLISLHVSMCFLIWSPVPWDNPLTCKPHFLWRFCSSDFCHVIIILSPLLKIFVSGVISVNLAYVPHIVPCTAISVHTL